MAQEIHNNMTFTEAYDKVAGSKFKIINGFKQFTTPEFDYEDMMVEADIAIMKAWREWDPSQTKFNTHATNMINWTMFKALENYNPVFRTNRKTKMNLHNRGESMKTLTLKKVTLSPEFNVIHGLDGVKPFTRELFNSYVYFTSSQVFGVTVKNQSQFDTIGDDEFNILEAMPDQRATDELRQLEIDSDLEKMNPIIKQVYDLVGNGTPLKDAMKELGTTKHKLKSLYMKGNAVKRLNAMLEYA